MDNGASSYRRFLDGDESAFDELMKELFHNLVFFIDQYVHDIHTAEDIAIDVFSDLIVHKHRYNFRVTLKTHLFMIGRSRALDYIRHRKVISFTPLSETEEFADEKNLEDSLLFDEKKRALHSAIQQLPLEMQTVIHLVYLEGMSYEEAAMVMKKKKKQVDNLLYRVKKELRILFGKAAADLAQNHIEIVNFCFKNDKFGYLSDICRAICNDEYQFSFGHQKTYWEKKGKRAKEIFSNIFSIEAMQDKRSITFLNQHFAGLMETYSMLLEDLDIGGN